MTYTTNRFMVAALLSILASPVTEAVPSSSVTTEGIAGLVRVTTGAQDTTLFVSGTTTVTVRAMVEQPSSQGPDGIFTYDLDLIVGDPSVLSIVEGTIHRPDIDPRLGGHAGRLVHYGLDAVAGGFFDLDRGIESPQVLFTVDLLATAVGSSMVTVGPDTDIYGVDILLAATEDPQIVYDLGPTIHVAGRPPPPTGVPEPHSALLGLIGLLASSLCAWGRRRSSRD